MAPAPIALDGNRKDLLSSHFLVARKVQSLSDSLDLFFSMKFGTGHVN